MTHDYDKAYLYERMHIGVGKSGALHDTIKVVKV